MHWTSASRQKPGPETGRDPSVPGDGRGVARLSVAEQKTAEQRTAEQSVVGPLASPVTATAGTCVADAPHTGRRSPHRGTSAPRAAGSRYLQLKQSLKHDVGAENAYWFVFLGASPPPPNMAQRYSRQALSCSCD